MRSRVQLQVVGNQSSSEMQSRTPPAVEAFKAHRSIGAGPPRARLSCSWRVFPCFLGSGLRQSLLSSLPDVSWLVGLPPTPCAAYLVGVTSSASQFGLAPALASEVDTVAASLGITPAELIDRAVRRELARQLLDGVFDRADGMDPDEAMSLVYSERDAARSQS